MEITLTELKNNLGRYILMSREEDILVTKNGKMVSRLTEPFAANRKVEKRKIAERLVGSIQMDYIDHDALRAERLSKR